ncbi:glycoside hydrolase family 43 protein [Desertivirga brevis]|uniref:glycoside hydrolase family 43 protein n=1 Tax=Desertivirga brevis TaxID=2810310 RepID=UPI001A967A3C|nr:glycoside hydrolase family 43 protein [Pedobacter sp. SYSU D00873]
MRRILAGFLVIAFLDACFTGRSPVVEKKTSVDQPTEQTFTNPIGKGADPWVIKYKGYYYTCYSSSGEKGRSGISVTKSPYLTKLGNAKIVWSSPESGWNEKNIWAPELHHIGKKWYIYYAGGKGAPSFINQRAGVLESVSEDPQGAYVDKGVIKTGTDDNDYVKTIWAIDMTVGKINKKWYAVWSGWEKNNTTDKTSQHLYIAKLLNPWTIDSERVKISSPDQNWETGGPLDLNEGPEFLQRNGKTFIIYSARESWTKEYRLGQLKLKGGSDPLKPESWEKKGPVFEGTDKVFGVGHASFTTSPDDKEWWIFYHTKNSTDHGWDRSICLQPFSWDNKGEPVFGRPLPAGTPIKKPSGERP